MSLESGIVAIIIGVILVVIARAVDIEPTLNKILYIIGIIIVIIGIIILVLALLGIAIAF